MVKKIMPLGVKLSRQEAKSLNGGIVWPDFRDFTCQTPLGVRPGGCSMVSGAAASCCIKKYGSSSFVGVNWGAYGCPGEIC